MVEPLCSSAKTVEPLGVSTDGDPPPGTASSRRDSIAGRNGKAAHFCLGRKETHNEIGQEWRRHSGGRV